jgi:hypothetical protein
VPTGDPVTAILGGDLKLRAVLAAAMDDFEDDLPQRSTAIRLRCGEAA